MEQWRSSPDSSQSAQNKPNHKALLTSILHYLHVLKNIISFFYSYLLNNESFEMVPGSGAGVSFGLQRMWNVVGRRKLLASEPLNVFSSEESGKYYHL